VAKKQGGQQPKLREAATRRKFLKAIRDGGSLCDAAYAVGASPDCVKRERKRDKEFDAKIKESIVGSKLALIKRSGEKKPGWMLAIRFHTEYGRKDRYTLQQVVELYDEWLEFTLPFVPEERRDAFKDGLQAKLTKLAIKAGQIPDVDSQ
jgi:hypothetical protein